jgi:hypothetical protein
MMPKHWVKRRTIQLFVLAIFMAFLLFGLAPSPIPAPANSELTSQVYDSVIILDSYLISRYESSYRLHVLIKKEAAFVPLQIRLPDSSMTYRIFSLIPNPQEYCPLADSRSQAAGIVSALKNGDLIAYSSADISDYKYAGTRTQPVDLIIDKQGKAFQVDGLRVSGECFWAQE